MNKKTRNFIAIFFITGALSGSIKAMEKTNGLNNLISTQNTAKNNQESLIIPFLLVAGSNAYTFRKEIKSCLKYCLIKSVLTTAGICKNIWLN